MSRAHRFVWQCIGLYAAIEPESSNEMPGGNADGNSQPRKLKSGMGKLKPGTGKCLRLNGMDYGDAWPHPLSETCNITHEMLKAKMTRATGFRDGSCDDGGDTRDIAIRVDWTCGINRSQPSYGRRWCFVWEISVALMVFSRLYTWMHTHAVVQRLPYVYGLCGPLK
jgi:hypothetical protein